MIENILRRFQFFPADTEQRREDHAAVRSAVADAAVQFDEILPEGREKALAITKLEEAMFWANAAVARA